MQVLICYHSQSGNTAFVVDCMAAQLTKLNAKFVVKRAEDTKACDIAAADGVIFATPENFGYMSGAMKSVLDRTYYELRGQNSVKPYALWVCASTAGDNTATQFNRIAGGMGLKQAVEPVIFRGRLAEQYRGKLSDDRLMANRDNATESAKLLAEAFYTGLEMGVL